MAKANTYRMESGGFTFRETCKLCAEKPKYRGFYYPTVMNGDAEWIGDFCEKHKSVDLKQFND